MSEKSITVLAHFYFKPKQIQTGQQLLAQLEKITPQEPGCLSYFLHQNTQDPTHFVMVESWKNQALLEQHFKMPHLAETRILLEPMLNKPIEVQILHKCVEK